MQICSRDLDTSKNRGIHRFITRCDHQARDVRRLVIDHLTKQQFKQLGRTSETNSRPAHPDRRATALGGLGADVTHTAPQTARQCSPRPGTVRSAPVDLDSLVTNEG